jgi:hypothetical protein
LSGAAVQQPSKDLLDTLKGEVMGEAFFRTAGRMAWSRPQKDRLAKLAQLETQTKERLLEYCERNRLDTPSLSPLAFLGSLAGVTFLVTPWSTMLKQTATTTERYMKIYKRLADSADEADKALFEYVVAHEVAIQQFAVEELAGNHNKSLKPIDALL